MEPEPDRVDLSSLEPPHREAAVASVVARVRARRRRLVQRGMTAVVVAAAAAALLWFSAPRREAPRARHTLLDWATHDVDASDVLDLGGNDAQ